MNPAKGHSKRWWIIAGLYTVINVGGALYAVAMGEMRHAIIHVVLMIAAIIGYGIWTALQPGAQQKLAAADPANDILDRLQQRVDGIAVEVERVGESQRFNASILEKRAPNSDR